MIVEQELNCAFRFQLFLACKRFYRLGLLGIWQFVLGVYPWENFSGNTDPGIMAVLTNFRYFPRVGAFVKLRNSTIRFVISIGPSVCLSAWNNSTPHWTDFDET